MDHGLKHLALVKKNTAHFGQMYRILACEMKGAKWKWFSFQPWICCAGFLVRNKCHPVFLLDLLSNPIWPHMHMLTHAETHTHIYRSSSWACPVCLPHVESPKIDMWTAYYKSTSSKLNCAKTIAVQIPCWMPLIFYIKPLSYLVKVSHLRMETTYCPTDVDNQWWLY